jgi:hypothetical protein
VQGVRDDRGGLVLQRPHLEAGQVLPHQLLVLQARHGLPPQGKPAVDVAADQPGHRAQAPSCARSRETRTCTAFVGLSGRVSGYRPVAQRRHAAAAARAAGQQRQQAAQPWPGDLLSPAAHP